MILKLLLNMKYVDWNEEELKAFNLTVHAKMEETLLVLIFCSNL